LTSIPTNGSPSDKPTHPYNFRHLRLPKLCVRPQFFSSPGNGQDCDESCYGGSSRSRSVTERATQTNELGDMNSAISEWEKVVQMTIDGGASEDRAEILASYASSFLMRWDFGHQVDDIRATVSNLEGTLNKLPQSSTKARYDLLIRLASVHEDWYQVFKDTPENLTRAIQYWEDAYGLSVVLRHTK
jgi:hypothetical protein